MCAGYPDPCNCSKRPKNHHPCSCELKFGFIRMFEVHNRYIIDCLVSKLNVCYFTALLESHCSYALPILDVTLLKWVWFRSDFGHVRCWPMLLVSVLRSRIISIRSKWFVSYIVEWWLYALVTLLTVVTIPNGRGIEWISMFIVARPFWYYPFIISNVNPFPGHDFVEPSDLAIATLEYIIVYGIAVRKS